MSLTAPAEQMVLPIGLPDLPVHLRLDGLSSAFLFLLGAASDRHFDLCRRLLPAR